LLLGLAWLGAGVTAGKNEIMAKKGVPKEGYRATHFGSDCFLDPADTFGKVAWHS
jgi:hypothetical protein